MEYDREDYLRLYGDKPVIQRREFWWVDWVLVAIFALIVSLQYGCDSHAQDAEIMQMARDKAAELPPRAYFDNPLGNTWVEQSGVDHKGKPEIRRHYSYAADLTRRQR